MRLRSLQYLRAVSDVYVGLYLGRIGCRGLWRVAMEDANRYCPQSSDMTPWELTDRSRLGFSCDLFPHVERGLCQQLFLHCDQVRAKRGLQLPPNRGESLA